MTDDDRQALHRIEASQARTEAKLDTLLQALGELSDDAQFQETGPDSKPLETGEPK